MRAEYSDKPLVEPENHQTSLVKTNQTNQQLKVHITELLSSKPIDDRLFVSLELCSIRPLDNDLLSKINPIFCSVIWEKIDYSDLTVEEIPAIAFAKNLLALGYIVVLHIAGRYLNTSSALNILKTAKSIGVRNLLLLQGDQYPQENEETSDFPQAIDLVRFVRTEFADYFCIGVAGYPEQHPNSKDLESDICHLKEKADLADFMITQACFDYKIFTEFVQTCRKNLISIPIIPGMFIISSFTTLKTMAEVCEIPVPNELLEFTQQHKINYCVLADYGKKHTKEMFDNFKNIENGLMNHVHVFSLNNLNFIDKVLKAYNNTNNIEDGNSTEKFAGNEIPQYFSRLYTKI